MISVPIDRIVPLTDARDNFSRLISDIETLSDGLYVLTKGGKPAIALINIKYLEEIMTNGPAANHELRITKHESDHKPEVSHKVHEPIHRPTPVKLQELPNPPAAPILPKPSFEVPRITTAPIGPSAEITSTSLGLNAPKVASPYNNYDVKPTVNPTWTGEEANTKPLAPSSLAPSINPSSFAPTPKPAASSPSIPLGVNQLPDTPPAGGLPPIAQFDKPFSPPPPPTPSKPVINPWPIIPPRSPQVTEKGYESSTTIPPRATSEQGIRDTSTVPPRRDDARDTSFATVPPRPVNTALPLAPSSLAPSPSSFTPVPKPEASSPPPVASLPDASYPKMVAPPPPPPPSSLPRIPSSFQTVPVPINGSKPPTTAPAPLPPPPITTAPAPFASSTPAVPTVTPKPADSIAFDQPPTTIPEPGEDLPVPSAIKTETPALVSTPTVTPVPADATPPQGQASVQDLEI